MNMKKNKKYVLLICLVISNYVNAQIVSLLNENFNNGVPAGWTRINNDGLVPNALVSFVTNSWVSYDDIDSLGIGDSVMVATSYYSPAGTADDWLISPPITLKGNGNFLNWQVRSQDPSYPDGYDVLISTTLPVIDSFYVDTALYSVDYEFPYWTDRSVSLDSFVNQTVYIAFRAKSNDQFLLLIDNVYMYADTLVSVQENKFEKNIVQAFPNPATDFINVRSEKNIESAMLVDFSGQVILNLSPRTKSFQFSVLNIPEGFYVLCLRHADGTQSQIKIIRT